MKKTTPRAAPDDPGSTDTAAAAPPPESPEPLHAALLTARRAGGGARGARIDAMVRGWLPAMERAFGAAVRAPVRLDVPPTTTQTLLEGLDPAEVRGRVVAAVEIHPATAPAATLFIMPDRALLGALIERFYGGGATPPAKHGRAGLVDRPLSNAEAMMLERLAFAAAAAIAQDGAASSARVVDPADIDDLTDQIGGATLIHALVLPVAIEGSGELGKLRMLVPAALTGVMAGPHDPERAARWRLTLAARLADVHVPAKGVLARPTLTLREIGRLRRGDIIPIGVPTRVPLIVGQRRMALGSIGERDGRAAFLVETLVENP